MRQKKIYLAGPMSGIPCHNFPAFHRAARKLRSSGLFVFNPAENWLPSEFVGSEEFKQGLCPKDMYREFLAEDLNFICREADAIALLPGWQKSKGASAEYATAVALGLGVILLSSDDTVSSVSGIQLDMFSEAA